MPLLSTGTPLSQKVAFNSGYVTFNSNQVVNLENVTIEANFSEKELRIMNSIKMATHKRATFKTGLKGKVKSMNKEFIALISGTSSTDGSGTLYTIKDGQTTTLNPIFTTYIDDDTSTPKVLQFQFSDALLLALPLTTNTEDYGSFDFEFSAIDVSIYTQNA